MYIIWVLVSRSLDLSCLENGKIENMIEEDIKT